jgi:hypothetical protein
MSNRATREMHAREAAECIVEQWEDKRRTWGHFLTKLFRLEAAGEAKSAATDLLKLAMPSAAGAGAGLVASGAAGAALSAGPILLGAAPGLAVGLVYYGFKTWNDLGAEEKGAPTRFLSAVAKMGGVLAAAPAPSLL